MVNFGALASMFACFMVVNLIGAAAGVETSFFEIGLTIMFLPPNFLNESRFGRRKLLRFGVVDITEEIVL